jgi:hypothetical protein
MSPVGSALRLCVCVCVVSRAHAALLQENARQKVLHHLRTSSLHWDSVMKSVDLVAKANETDIWTEEPLASIVLITSCIAVVRCF